jgi:hypothetical protein
MRILTEMPYIKNPGEGGLYDLEIERFHDPESIINYLEQIFSGKEFKDKYGNIIKLSNTEEKRKVANDIKNNKGFYDLIVSKLTNREIRLLTMILNY